MPANVDFPRSRKLIFVIMPFTASPTRKTAELNEFYEHEIKQSIESNTSFLHSYEVRRSGVDFDIAGQIIRDLFEADLVICDLSGEAANPNVMFELGVRLTCSNKPVILIREEHPNNRSIFDVQGLHTHPYNPMVPSKLREHLADKIHRFEGNQEQFRSPVLTVLGDTSRIHRIDRIRAANLLAMVNVGLFSHLRSLASLINDHLEQLTELRLGPNVFLLAQQIEENWLDLQQVDWSEVRLAMGPHPALAYYLSNRYLDGILEENLERRFSFAMLTFYERYFVNLMELIGFDLERVSRFARHAAILSGACELTNTLLRLQEDTREYHEASTRLGEVLDKLGA